MKSLMGAHMIGKTPIKALSFQKYMGSEIVSTSFGKLWEIFCSTLNSDKQTSLPKLVDTHSKYK